MACEHNENINCTCPDSSCDKHGKCCECVSYHKENGDLPMCLR